MSEVIIIGVATLVVFSLFLIAMVLKEIRAAAKPPIHTCANKAGCQCRKSNDPDASPTPPRPCTHKNRSTPQRA